MHSTKYYFDVIDPESHPQVNQSVNAMKAGRASKGCGWRSSFAMRMCLTILHTNDPYKYSLTLVDHRGIELSNREKVENMINKDLQTRTKPKGARKNKLLVSGRRSRVLTPHLDRPVLRHGVGDQEDFSQHGDAESVSLSLASDSPDALEKQPLSSSEDVSEDDSVDEETVVVFLPYCEISACPVT
jgi:hypothetical protein